MDSKNSTYGQKKLLQTIEQACQNQATTLDLSQQELTTLPSAIGKLTNLKRLRLQGNQLTSLPPEIGQLTQLTELYLNGNLLTTLPSEIGKLPKLRSLNLHSNQLRTLSLVISQLAKLTWLNLGNNQLTTLPPEIGQLFNLKNLRLQGNQLTHLPPEIGKLINLAELYLGGYEAGNQLTALPPEISQLTKLTRLDLGGNKLTTLPPEISQLTKLIRLDLGGNQLTALPPEISQLTKLTELHLGNNKLTALPPEISHLFNLERLYIQGNQLSTLPPEIGKLTNLTELYLGGFESGNQLAALPSEISQLTKLTRLDLGGNNLTTLLTKISRLTKITRLDLGGNKLSILPPEISQLTKLTELYLGSNQLITIPPKIGKLINLKRLHLQGDQLTHLPPEIGKLTNLTELYLGDNKLTTLPPEISQLTKLTELHLSDNKLTALPPEISQLTKLTRLDLRGNNLTTLSSKIGQLTKLTRLDLSSNKLTTLPPEIGNLSELTQLHLSDNRLSTLPIEISQLDKLTWLDLDKNTLMLPPEILVLKDQPAEILNYYQYQLHQATLPAKSLNEAKLIVVGQGGVGKTSMVRRLVEGRFNEHETKTKGIDTQKWLLEIQGREIHLNIWDFGGQEIIHATHQFFLTKRSLYVLVLDARQGEQDSKIEYWLKLIQSFGEESPIIVVVNKIEEHDLGLNQRGLQGKFPSVKNFAKISCKNNIGLVNLKEIIKNEANRLEHITTKWHPAWYAIKTKLNEMRQDYIPYEEYVRMCQVEGVTDDLSQRTLIRFLNDLGIVLNFQDDPRLEDTNILNPKWVTNGVYMILNSNELFQNKGVLERQMLNKILDNRTYPRNKHLFIIDMMRKFELCFDVEGFPDQKFLIPDLLPKEEPYTGDWPDALLFQFHYDILPSSIISRFIVRVHSYIHQNTYWRNGVVLAYGGNKALVKADMGDKKIFIWISGTKRTRRDFLSNIRFQFGSIHKTISGIEVSGKVPLPGYPKIVVDYKHLLNLEEMGEESYPPEGLKERINVKKLLDGIESEQERRKEQQNPQAQHQTGGGIRSINVYDNATVMVEPSGQINHSKKVENVKQKKQITVGDNVQISAPVTIADNIENSFNTLTEATINDEIKALLDQLLKAVIEVNEESPQEHAEEAQAMTRDADTLIKEVTSSKPRHQWYEVSIDGLTQAATNIGEVAESVLKIVGKLRLLLLP